jgi:hypothetical protein
MAEYIVLVALLLPGFQGLWKLVRGKLQLSEVRVTWPWWSKPRKS